MFFAFKGFKLCNTNRIWLSGGRTVGRLTIEPMITQFGNASLRASHRARPPVLGGFLVYVLTFDVRTSASDCAGPTIKRINSCTTAAPEP